MLRYLFASLLLVTFTLADASAQTRPARAARRKIAPYSTRGARRAPNINPHTGKPYGAGVPQDVKDGQTHYLAPSMVMRRQTGYQNMSSYSGRAPRPSAKKAANSSLARDNSAPAATPTNPTGPAPAKPAPAKGKGARK